MKSYRELVEQTFEFPQKEFKVRDHELLFNDVPLMDIIKAHGGVNFAAIPCLNDSEAGMREIREVPLRE